MTWGRDTDEHEAADQLKAFLEAGGTLLDTAAGYGDGESERLIGGLLAAVVDREDVVLATKAGISRRTGERVVDASRRALLDALDGSLQRLGTDHVDLWQVHTWSDDVAARGDARGAVDTAVATGPRALRRHLQLLRLADRAGRDAASEPWPGRAPLVSTQMEYSLLQRGIEREVLPGAAALGPRRAALVAAGPRRADRQVPHRHPGGLARRVTALRCVRRALPRRPARAASWTRSAHGGRGAGASPVEVALAWVRDAPGVDRADRRGAYGGAAARLADRPSG